MKKPTSKSKKRSFSTSKKLIIGGVSTLAILGIAGGIVYAVNEFNRVELKDKVIVETGTNINKIKTSLFVEKQGNLSSNAKLTITKKATSQNKTKEKDKTKNEGKKNGLETIKIFTKDDKEIEEAKAYKDGDKKVLNDGIKKEEVIKGVGTYDVTITYNKTSYQTVLIINDKTKPELKLKDAEIIDGDNIDVNSYVESCKDNSHIDCTLEITDKDGKKVELNKAVGEHEVYITATDESKNKTTEKTKLIVKEKPKEVAEDTSSSSSSRGSSKSTSGRSSSSSRSSGGSSSSGGSCGGPASNSSVTFAKVWNGSITMNSSISEEYNLNKQLFYPASQRMLDDIHAKIHTEISWSTARSESYFKTVPCRNNSRLAYGTYALVTGYFSENNGPERTVAQAYVNPNGSLKYTWKKW